jgi:hypothetical protein
MFDSFTKGITISRKSKKTDKTGAKIKLTIEQTMIYKTQDRTLKIKQPESHYNRGWTHVPLKGIQFFFHVWHPSCYSCDKPGDKSVLRKGQSMITGTTRDYLLDIYYVAIDQVMVATVELSKWWLQHDSHTCVIYYKISAKYTS